MENLHMLVLVLALGNDSYLDREQANAALKAIPFGIKAELKYGVLSKDFEIRRRCQPLYNRVCEQELEVYRKTYIPGLPKLTRLSYISLTGTVHIYDSRRQALELGHPDAAMFGRTMYLDRSTADYIWYLQSQRWSTEEILTHLETIVRQQRKR